MTEPALILYVNDDAASLYLGSKLLRAAGFRVVEERTGFGALDRARASERPDAVVLDIWLPDLSGHEVCRQLKADPSTRGIKILYTSASLVSASDRVDGLDSGADGFITQPFEPRELVAIVRSLVRLRRVEMTLDERVIADRNKDEFLAMLAHELRNPLAAIRMALPIMEQFPSRNALESRARQIVDRQSGMLERLIDDVLDVSRVTTGRIPLRRQRMDVVELLASVCETVGLRSFVPRGQSLTVDMPPRALYVNGDAGRLEQVFTNLLDNAAKYSSPTEPVAVSVVGTNDAVEIRVLDRGAGIEGTVLPHVFDLFTQGATTLSRARGGLGIGLTLVKRLVELHDGAIEARSDGPGMGAEFTVRLPRLLEEGPIADEAATDATLHDHSSCKVLLVDDNEDARELLRELCEIRGLDVAEAGDGPDGVNAALTFRPHLAFIDIGLPGFDGFDVTG